MFDLRIWDTGCHDESYKWFGAVGAPERDFHIMVDEKVTFRQVIQDAGLECTLCHECFARKLSDIIMFFGDGPIITADMYDKTLEELGLPGEYNILIRIVRPDPG